MNKLSSSMLYFTSYLSVYDCSFEVLKLSLNKSRNRIQSLLDMGFLKSDFFYVKFYFIRVI